jgi:YVTN family beta-propeller protein
VIDTATNTVIATIPVGESPRGVAVTPDGSKVYVTNVELPPNPPVVSVIATATNTVIATIPLGGESNGVAVTPDGRKVYVANSGSNNVFVIDTASNLVLAVVSVGIQPVAFGAFIRQPAPLQPAPFAGTPREPGCHGKSVSALAEQFGGLPAAATARGFSSVPALQDAINVFCRGGAAAAD